eukprot:TRINITY_DN83370_c0_g1_i1.p1 TRINITY_DN83370_c0_g1~~TRINITY_DN83370_c0_g1_i1.p1  ORF type:complete len:938 (+),score=157.13 TRINITY_DN83370_c0_g1_i1:185-2998(+)
MPRSGDIVGDYEVLRLLGRGAHGTVVKVRGPGRSQQIHAMKLLHCDVPKLLGGSDQSAREKAFAEADLLRRLRHPHIVSCLDVAWDPAEQAVRLLLEYMDGGDLQGLIESRKDAGEQFEAHFARRVLAAVGGALAYIHAADVLHRDVKPANILLTSNSQRIKLADFGIAKLLEHTNHARTVVGTPYYLSPEIVAGQAYDEASDAWALGVCLYELATLQRPFDAGNQLALVRRICSDRQEPVPQDVAPDVRRTVDGLLEKDIQARMTLQEALSISPAVAALVVSGSDHNTRRPESPAESLASELASSSSFVELASDGARDFGKEEAALNAWCGSRAAAAAREALADDVDDPEELMRALAALEKEREQQRSLAATGGGDSVSELSMCFESLEKELKLRIAALRIDAAAMLSSLDEATGDLSAEELEHNGRHRMRSGGNSSCDGQLEHQNSDRTAETKEPPSEEEEPEDDCGLSVVASSSASPRGTPSSNFLHVTGAGLFRGPGGRSRGNRGGPACAEIESALEVATSLGVDTAQSEERIAHRRGMLSLRVKWGGLARFCMLPVTVGFDSLVAEVSRRFGLVNCPLPQLCWREAEESFSLECQADWDECLQRRGLLSQPGRLELYVRSDDAPPRRMLFRGRAQPQPLHSTAASFASTGRRQDLFTWKVSPRGASAMRPAGGPACGTAASTLRRGLSRSGRALITPHNSVGLSKGREPAVSSAAPPPQTMTPLSPVESECDAEPMKMSRLHRNSCDRLGPPILLQADLSEVSELSCAGASMVMRNHGGGTATSTPMHATMRGYGLDFNSSSPSADLAQLTLFSREGYRSTTALPSIDKGLTLDVVGRLPPSPSCEQPLGRDGVVGSRMQVRCVRPHPASRCRATPLASEARRAGGNVPATGGNSGGLWATSTFHASRTLTSVGQAMGSGPLSHANGRGVAR